MKGNMPFKEKLMFMKYIITGEEKPMVSVSCHYCGSFRIKYDKGERKENEYSSEYTCAVCGAKAINIESWSRKVK